jgi:hypothetical protein
MVNRRHFTCTEVDCGRPHAARGFCFFHYHRHRAKMVQRRPG